MKLPKSLAVIFLAAVTSCTNPQDRPSRDNTASTSNEAPTPTCAPAYAVDVHLSQSRVSLDLWEHAKDAMNAADFSIPVSRELYRELHEGDDIVNSFRGGSLVFSGSWGSTHLKVEDIPEVCTTADTTSYEVTLKLKQSHLSLDLGKHFKDAANAVEFKWRVPAVTFIKACTKVTT